MKKRYLLIVIFLSFFFFGCDGNFGVKSLNSTYLVIKDVGDSDIELFCEAEKIWIPTLMKCEETTSEKTIEWIAREKNIENTGNIKVFEIPTYRNINDRNNIDIYFEANINMEKYTGNLFIKSLQEDSGGTLFSDAVVLKSAKSKELSAIFCYQFWRSI